MIDTVSVLGYAQPTCVAPGERVRFYLSSEHLNSVDLDIVRVRSADPDANGPGYKVTPMPSRLDGPVRVAWQPVYNGSCGIVDDTPVLAQLQDFSFGCYLFPTLPGGACQTILGRWTNATRTGWRLYLDEDGHLCTAAALGAGPVVARSPQPLVTREWIFVGGSVSLSTGTVSVFGLSLEHDGGRSRDFSETVSGLSGIDWPANVPFIFAAHSSGVIRPAKPTDDHYNGKIDRPRLVSGVRSRADMQRLSEAISPVQAPEIVGAWDFSQKIPTDDFVDLSANRLDGRLVQLPTRGVTGANWTGCCHGWPQAASEYGAIHFHADDLENAEWNVSQELEIPGDWPSGFYALRATGERDGRPVESNIPFFVRPHQSRTDLAPVVVIAPTATYLAYANNRAKVDQSHFEVMADSLLVLTQDEICLSEHREFGHSTYDTHADGSGVCYSSAARPILNGRPRSNSFNYVNDTHLLDWLEEVGIVYEVITDEVLHREGARALRPYRVAITMTHPEYTSREMNDALASFQNGGGRHMYLGGNGFYWTTTFHPTKPGLIEIRRGIAGTRSWEAEAGEINLSFTGEPSGLWRSNGRAPQRLVGVGFSAQVFDVSTFYRRLPASYGSNVSFAFEGIGDDELIGNFGWRLGGAAGLEIDRADPMLGTSPDAIVLATADRTGPGGVPTPEELPAMHRGITGEESSLCRADLVFTPTSAGGAVFSTGSIAWCCALSVNNYDNNVSRMTLNVLKRFLDPRPFS